MNKGLYHQLQKGSNKAVYAPLTLDMLTTALIEFYHGKKICVKKTTRRKMKKNECNR